MPESRALADISQYRRSSFQRIGPEFLCEFPVVVRYVDRGVLSHLFELDVIRFRWLFIGHTPQLVCHYIGHEERDSIEDRYDKEDVAEVGVESLYGPRDQTAGCQNDRHSEQRRFDRLQEISA